MLEASLSLHAGSPSYDVDLFRTYCLEVLHEDPEVSVLGMTYIARHILAKNEIDKDDVLACKEIAMFLYDKEFELESDPGQMMKVVMALDGKIVLPTAVYLAHLLKNNNKLVIEMLVLAYTDVRVHGYAPLDVLNVVSLFHKKALAGETSEGILLRIIQAAVLAVKGVYPEAERFVRKHSILNTTPPWGVRTLTRDLEMIDDSESESPRRSRSNSPQRSRSPASSRSNSPHQADYSISEDDDFEEHISLITLLQSKPVGKPIKETSTVTRVRIDNKAYAAKTFEMTYEDLRSLLKEIGVGCTFEMRPTKYIYITPTAITIYLEYYYKSLESLIYMDSPWTQRIKKWEDVWLKAADPQFALVFIDDRRRYAKELFSILRTIHSYGIIHQDIKPDNLMIDDSHSLKLIDFSSCSLFNTTDAKYQLVQGTPLYRDYNLLQGSTYYSTEADIWSAGITLLEMEKGCLPTQADSGELLDSVKKIFGEGLWANTIKTLNFASLLIKMFDLDRSRRINANECLILMNEAY